MQDRGSASRCSTRTTRDNVVGNRQSKRVLQLRRVFLVTAPRRLNLHDAHIVSVE